MKTGRDRRDKRNRRGKWTPDPDAGMLEDSAYTKALYEQMAATLNTPYNLFYRDSKNYKRKVAKGYRATRKVYVEAGQKKAGISKGILRSLMNRLFGRVG